MVINRLSLINWDAKRLFFFMLSSLKILLASNIILALISSLGIALANPIREYKEIDNIELKLEIGKKIYNQAGDGCWSCHGAEGIKADGVSLDNKEKHKISDKKEKMTPLPPSPIFTQPSLPPSHHPKGDEEADC